jgi:hypothetical protein
MISLFLDIISPIDFLYQKNQINVFEAETPHPLL